VTLASIRDGARVPVRIAVKELAVFFERRTAAGGIDHVHVGTARFERGDIALCERAPAIHFARVNRDRSAAALIARYDRLDAGAREHAYRCFVPIREGDVHDAAGVKERR
jgi:hypothetical protein